MNLSNIAKMLVPVMVKEKRINEAIENCKDISRREKLEEDLRDLSSYRELLELKIQEIAESMGIDEIQEEIELINISIGTLSINVDLLDQRIEKASLNKDRVFDKELYDLGFEYDVVISECNMKKDQIDDAISCYYRVVDSLVKIKNKKRSETKMLTLSKAS